MGIWAEAKEAVVGFNFGEFGDFWPDDAFCSDMEEDLSEFWAEFFTAYDSKYPGLKDSGLGCFVGSECSYDPDSDDGKEFIVVFGFEVLAKRIVTTEKGIQLHFDFPLNVNEIMHDFIAFNRKYGEEYLAAKKSPKMSIIPEEEAAELVEESGIDIPKNAGVYKFVFYG